MTSLLRTFALGLGLLPLAFASIAEARPFRVNDIPNGNKNTCLNCHGDLKASYNTDFGSDARNTLMGSGTISEQHVTWSKVCPWDSDRDGWTNGEELGDPDCVWQIGDPNPKASAIYNPGNPDSAPPPVCGSGALEAFEPCEGDLFVTKSCAELGAGEGTLACTADCKLDYSGCSEPPGETPPPQTGGAAEETGCSFHPSPTRAPGALALSLVIAMGLARRKRR